MKGLHLIRINDTGLEPANQVLFVIQGSDDSVFYMFDCIVEIDAVDQNLDNRVCFIGDTASLHNCTFRRTDNNCQR